MGVFDYQRPGQKPEEQEGSTSTFKPFYRVYTQGPDGDQIDHEPDCVVEAVAVGNQAHYVVKRRDNSIDAMYPFSSVECVQRIVEPEE